MSAETGPSKPEQTYQATSKDPSTGQEVTLETNVPLAPGMTVGEAVLEIGGVIRPDETPPATQQ